MSEPTTPETLSADPAQPSQTAPTSAAPDANPPETLTADTPETLTADAPAPTQDPNKVLASTKYAGAPSTEAPGFVQRAAETSGAAGVGNLLANETGYLGTMPLRTYHRIQGLQEAYTALREGDLHRASMIAHTLASGPDDPITSMALNLIKLPYEEAVNAYKAYRDNPDKTSALLNVAQHGIRMVPVIGAGAEQVGSTIADDLKNHNWSGVSGDVVGLLPALLFGGETKAAQAAAAATDVEGAAEAAATVTQNAIRPSQRLIANTAVPTTALQDVKPSLAARSLQTVANDPASAQARFAAERTQPAAVNATVNNLEDVARNHIQELREVLGDHTPFEEDMSSLRKQSGAMKNSAQEVYKRFDAASDAEQEAYKTKTKLAEEAHNAEQEEKEAAFNEAQDAKKEAFDKNEQFKVKASANGKTPYKAKPFKAEKFEGEDFEPEERPLTFRELQSQRQDAIDQMKSGSPEAYRAGKNALRDTEKEMDNFAQRHEDYVSTEQYDAANAARKAAGQHDFIADRIKIDSGTDEIPASITKGSLKTLPQAFDKRYGEGAFQKYLGPEGFKNYNAVRDVLQNPATASPLFEMAKSLMRHATHEAVGGGLGYAAGGIPGAVAGTVAQYAAGRIAENLLFNPEFGQTVMAAYKHVGHLMPAAKATVQGAARVAAPASAVTHTWNPQTGITPVQQQ
jgi:hypothetical protein